MSVTEFTQPELYCYNHPFTASQAWSSSYGVGAGGPFVNKYCKCQVTVQQTGVLSRSTDTGTNQLRFHTACPKY